MLNLAIGDKLLIMQTSAIKVTPWQYRLTYLATETIVTSATGISADYALVSLTDAAYRIYEGKSLLLEILNSSDVLIEDDMLLITGPYGKLESMKLLVGLLGENYKFSAALSADYQDGHEKHKDITLYNEAAMSTELATYDWNQAFVADFTPDARYQVDKINQSKD